MLGKTYQSTKRRSPAYTLTGRNKYGSFSDDFQKVIIFHKIELNMECSQLSWIDFTPNKKKRSSV